MDLTLVDNEPKFYEFIRELRLHPENINGFTNQNYFTEEEQKKYMEKNEKHYKICLKGTLPVGFVGVIDGDIRVATKPEFKGMGIGKFMINEIMKTYPNSFAKIKLNNESSIKLFESCDFEIKYIKMER